MNDIKFGIIGTGRMATAMMAAFSHLNGAKVVAVASDTTGRADTFAKFFAIPKAYSQIDALLADPDVEAVYITNATESHAQTTMRALAAGKAVLCEKPIAISEAECKQIEIAASKSGLLCMEAMWTLFLPAYQRLFGLVVSKSLGEPVHLYTDFGYPASKAAYPRLFSPGSGSGVLLDRTVYPIALALKVFGPVTEVNGRLNLNAEGVDTDAFLYLKHGTGSHTQLAVSVGALMQNRAVVSSAGGSISLEPPVIGAETVTIRHAHPDDKITSFETQGMAGKLKQQLRQLPILRRVHAMKNLMANEHHSWGANQYLPMLKHFCDLYRAGKLASDVMPLGLSAQILHVVDQAKKL